MEEEKDAFYVVRKGDVVGIYKSLSDCQAQVGNSVCGPSVSVFKGYSLPKETEQYLSSRGFQNAIYTVNANDVNEDLFGELVPCPFQQPTSSKGTKPDKASPSKRSQEVLELSNNGEAFGSTSHSAGSRKCIKVDSSDVEIVNSSKTASCILEFDGASKGNPGPAGAGAVLKTEDGRVLCRLREGVGVATNNAAEYRALLLGLKHALKKGFKRISAQGDSKLVVMQVQDLWKCKNDNMATLCKEAKELKAKFLSFQIRHVMREFNSEADDQANLAIYLKDGQVQADYGKS